MIPFAIKQWIILLSWNLVTVPVYVVLRLKLLTNLSLFYSFIISNEIWLKSRTVETSYGSVAFIRLYMGSKLPQDHADPSSLTYVFE